MSIVTKIKRSVESATGLTMHYHDEGTINEIIYSSPMPCCFFALLRDTELLTDGSQNRERASIAMFFVDKTEFDFDSEENEEIIEKQNEATLQFFSYLWDAYKRSYELEQEAARRQAQLNLEMFHLNMKMQKIML